MRLNRRNFIFTAAFLFIISTVAVWASGSAENGISPAGSGEAPSVGEQTPIVFTDASGREITLDKPAEKIAYTFALGEPVSIMGVWDKVVAVDGSHEGGGIHHPDSEGLPVISSPGNCMQINFEKVLELQPDVFLTVYSPAIPGFDELVETLEPEIQVVALNFMDPDTIVENFENFGKLLGKEDRAKEYIEFYNGILNTIEQKTESISGDERIRIFYKMGYGGIDELITFTGDDGVSGYRDKITGSVNISDGLPSQGGWILGVDPEWLIMENPDVIIDGGMYYGIIGAEAKDRAAAKDLRTRIMEQDILKDLDAVKNDRLFIVWTESFMSPGFIFNYAYIAKRIYPGLFEDFDPASLHQEYFTRFLGIDFDMSERGIFVYP